MDPTTGKLAIDGIWLIITPYLMRRTPRPMEKRDFLKAFVTVAAGILIPTSAPAVPCRFAQLQTLLASTPNWTRSTQYMTTYCGWRVCYEVIKPRAYNNGKLVVHDRVWMYARLTDNLNPETLALIDADALRAFTRLKLL